MNERQLEKLLVFEMLLHTFLLVKCLSRDYQTFFLFIKLLLIHIFNFLWHSVSLFPRALISSSDP